MAIYVGTFQLDNGRGEFFRSTASRALTLANKIALRTSHGHFVDDEHRSGGDGRVLGCAPRGRQKWTNSTCSLPGCELRGKAVADDPREFALIISDYRVTQCQCVSGY